MITTIDVSVNLKFFGKNYFHGTQEEMVLSCLELTCQKLQLVNTSEVFLNHE